jgi:hypothetical protein
VDNKKVDWTLHERADGIDLEPSTDTSFTVFTAPKVAGTYHVAAISQANPSALAIATIVVN